jgi:hypothetical protein
MERIAEHDRAITQAMKIRDDYARSAQEAASVVNQSMLKIDHAQSDKMMDYQLEVLKKRALKYEQQLIEATEKYDEEMKERELLCAKQKKELLQERKKNKVLEQELRVFEDSVINGTALLKETMMRKSPDSSPEVPNPKKARVDLIEDTSPPLSQLDNSVNRLSDKTKSLKAQTAQMKAYNWMVEDISVEPVKVVTHEERRDCGKDIVWRKMANIS